MIYAARGDYVNASLSTAAMVPIVGWGATGIKIATKTAQLNAKTRKAKKGLEIAERFLGAGYREIDNGVFRSADGLRQFRMTDGDILGRHGDIGPHFNFEVYDASNLRKPITNYHMPISD